MYGESGGKTVHMNVSTRCIHLHVGHRYIMTFLRLQCNCNGTLIIRLIVMVFLINTKIVMAPIQLILFFLFSFLFGHRDGVEVVDRGFSFFSRGGDGRWGEACPSHRQPTMDAAGRAERLEDGRSG